MGGSCTRSGLWRRDRDTHKIVSASRYAAYKWSGAKFWGCEKSRIFLQRDNELIRQTVVVSIAEKTFLQPLFKGGIPCPHRSYIFFRISTTWIFQGRETAFLIQNMCPATSKYLTAYIDKNNCPIRIDDRIATDVTKNARHVLALARRGARVIFPDIFKIYDQLEQQISESAPQTHHWNMPTGHTPSL